MDLSYGSIPNLSVQQPYDFNDSMGKAVTLANMMDARKANLASQQRQGTIRNIMGQDNTLDDSGAYTPQTVQQVAGQDPELAMSLQKQNAETVKAQAEAQYWKQHGDYYQNNPQVQKVEHAYINGIMDHNSLMAKQTLDSGNYSDPNTGMVGLQHLADNETVMKMPNGPATSLIAKYQQDPTQYNPDEVKNTLGLIASQQTPEMIAAQSKFKTAGAAEKNADTKAYTGEAGVDQDQQKIDLAKQAQADKNAYNSRLLDIKAAMQRRQAAKLGAAVGKLSDMDKQELGEVKTELTGKGTIGVQSKKIDAAIDTRAAMNRYYDPKTGTYNVPSSGYAELATSLSNMLSVSGGGSGTETQRKELQQATAEGDLNKVLSYWSGVPKNATTQQALDIVAKQIDAVGLQSEQNRNGYFPNIAKKYTDIGQDPQRALAIAQHSGNNYSDFLKDQYEQLGFPLDERTQQQLYKAQAVATGARSPGIGRMAKYGGQSPVPVVNKMSDEDALNAMFPKKK